MATEDDQAGAQRVLELLADRLRRDRPEPGHKVATERQLVEELGVTRWMIRRALGVLEQQGEIRRVPGRSGGVFIAGKVQRDLSRIIGVPDYLRGQGFTAGTRVVSTSTVPCDELVASELGLAAGQYVFEIVRIRLADSQPISLEEAFFPADRFPGLLEKPLGESLYAVLERDYGVAPSAAVEFIEAVPAGPAEAKVLEVEPGAPLLAISRTARDREGRPFEFSRDLFRADRTQIVVHLTGDGRSQGVPVPKGRRARRGWASGLAGR